MPKLTDPLEIAAKLNSLSEPNELNASTKLISHLKQFRDRDLNSDVLKRTKLCLLDTLACYYAGLSLPHFKQSVIGAKNSFFVNASQVQPAPFFMAYVFGQAANALDFDDTLYGHPGAPIIGAVLAVAAKDKLSIDRVLRGIVCGYEASAILAAAGTPSLERASVVRGVSVWDTIAASVGASVALGFDDAMIERVIDVAAAHSILPYTAKWYERPVPAMKNNMGWRAGGAVIAVNLVLAGQSGITRALDGDTGMWRMAGSDRWTLDDSLFLQKPAVLRVGFKLYPGCWHTQEYLKTLSTLLAKLESDHVTKIVVSAPVDMEKFCETKITNTADIAFNLPALFSQLISGTEAGPGWEDSDQCHPSYEFYYEQSETSTILVQTRNGQKVILPVRPNYSSDQAQYGLDDDGVIAKFDRFADHALSSDLRPVLVGDCPSSLEKVPMISYHSISQSMQRL